AELLFAVLVQTHQRMNGFVSKLCEFLWSHAIGLLYLRTGLCIDVLFLADCSVGHRRKHADVLAGLRKERMEKFGAEESGVTIPATQRGGRHSCFSRVFCESWASV